MRLSEEACGSKDLTNRSPRQRYNPLYAAPVGHFGGMRGSAGGDFVGANAWRRLPRRRVAGGTQRIFFLRLPWGIGHDRSTALRPDFR